MKIIAILIATTSLYAGYYLYNDYYRKDVVFATSKLKIQTSNETHEFKIKIADNYAKLQRGLMFVKELDDNEGMIFIYPDISVRKMWMKNTFIPLDMLFVSENFKILHIAKNTTPHSEELISSLVPVKYAIEVKAGITDKLSIKEGDLIIYNQ